MSDREYQCLCAEGMPDRCPCNIEPVDSWCERCGRKHVMRGQVEPCMGCGGNRFVFRNPAAGETP